VDWTLLRTRLETSYWTIEWKLMAWLYMDLYSLYTNT
jgi:hypothetical protein